jgi:hypothetical protein
VESLLRRTQERARELGGVVRWVLKYDLTGAATEGLIHEVPWELAFDGQRDRFVVLDDEALFLRHLRGEGDSWEPVSEPLRMLVSSACPSGAEELSVDRELMEVVRIMGRQPDRTRIRTHQLASVSQSRLVQEFNHARVNDRPFHVWHHCGHGRLDGRGRAVLVLHAEDGVRTSGVMEAEPGLLVETLARQGGLRLLVLNICHGAARGGLATMLASAQVPAAIGFPRPIADASALQFAEHLWRSLSHRPVDEAVHETRVRLATTRQPLDFARVLLFLRSLDRPLLIGGEPGVPGSRT